ncbi:MAG: methyltransferase domain-containing protein [Candidatus Woesearchaeota archaeon]|nr:methyltransferase domain-containing protein [Candidatus Woesearchaeota archaeon]
MIQHAQQQVPSATFHAMDLRTLKFPDASFDAIWANASYVHITRKELLLALREAHRVLKPNGVLYVSMKQGDGERLIPDDRYGGVEKFWCFVQQEELETYLQEAGFTIVSSHVKHVDSTYATNPWICVSCVSRKVSEEGKVASNRYF